LGDYQDRDESLRIREIKIIGDYAITPLPEPTALRAIEALA
jgi:hypothetical protein